MNDELKAVHMQTITHPDAVRMYDDLCAACEMREGGMTDPDQMLVADIARADQTGPFGRHRCPRHRAGTQQWPPALLGGKQKRGAGARLCRAAKETSLRITADTEQQKGGPRHD